MERAKIDGLEGLVLVSVWQDLQQRQSLATDLAIQNGLTALFLIATVCIVVIFESALGSDLYLRLNRQSVFDQAQT